MEYQVGDVVTIRSDLSLKNTNVVESMLEYAGRTAVIRSLKSNSTYGLAVRLEDIPYTWYPDTFNTSEELVWDI